MDGQDGGVEVTCHARSCGHQSHTATVHKWACHIASCRHVSVTSGRTQAAQQTSAGVQPTCALADGNEDDHEDAVALIEGHELVVVESTQVAEAELRLRDVRRRGSAKADHDMERWETRRVFPYLPAAVALDSRSELRSIPPAPLSVPQVCSVSEDVFREGRGRERDERGKITARWVRPPVHAGR